MFESRNATVNNTREQVKGFIDTEAYDTNSLDTSRHQTSTHTIEDFFDDFGPFSNMDFRMTIGVAVSSFLIACLVFFFLIQKKKAPRGRFMKWLREFLNFRSIMIAGIIKFLYVFLAVALTITSVIVMCQGRDDTVLPMILIGLGTLIIGNIMLRIAMEMMMAIISMWDNTSDIRGVLVKEEEKSPEKVQPEPKSPEKVQPEPKSPEKVQPEPKSPETVQPETPPVPSAQ